MQDNSLNVRANHFKGTAALGTSGGDSACPINPVLLGAEDD